MFRRENGRVYLDLSEDDFDALLLTLGYAAGAARDERDMRLSLRVANAVNEGNPQWTPYALDDDQPHGAPGPC